MILGQAVSPGIAWGAAHVVHDAGRILVPRRAINDGEVDAEVGKFDAAMREAEGHLLALQKDVRQKIGKREAEIFGAQIVLLHDPSLRDEVAGRCRADKINIEAALASAIEKFAGMFVQMDDSYFRDKASDVRDVGRRLLDILLKRQQEGSPTPPEGAIVIAHELLPSTTARMNLRAVRGLVLEGGAQTSHAAILTRSLGMPSVVQVTDALKRIQAGDQILVDGLAGRVFINPSRSILKEYERLQGEFEALQNALQDQVALPAVTADGVPIKVSANIGKSADAEAAFRFRAEGIGLYRTEFIFLVHDQFPTEEEQCRFYKTVAERLAPQEVVIRVLDVGGDKLLPYFPLPPETNPSLGCRGIRLLLKHPAILKTQLRAILRVSAANAVSILLPMIGSVGEVREARKILEAVKTELRAKKLSFNPQIRVGAMIETPAAAILARDLAVEVDFFSIGTNDLIQYLLTADRTSAEAAAYYEPLHPAVLRVLKSVLEAARRAEKSVSVCGEMAGNPDYTELLLGLGVRHLSLTPGEIPQIKVAIRSINSKKAEMLASRALELATTEEIRVEFSQHRAQTTSFPPAVVSSQPIDANSSTGTGGGLGDKSGSPAPGERAH
jgi:phosphotransferase system enzyme I (PtsI)